MTQALFYSSTAVSMQLSAPAASGDVTITLNTTTGLPASFPYKLLLDWGAASQEVVYVTAISGSIATVLRGKDGTTAQSHATGATVVHGVSAEEYNTAQVHIAATTAVHGITSSFVGTTDAQTLTNKTLTQPAISDFTSAGHIHAGVATGGALVQANTHGSPDTDVAAGSLHHTIGVGATQSAAGNHGHSGVYQPVGSYQPAGSYAAGVHSHAESDVTSLTTDLGNKSNVGHTHGYVGGSGNFGAGVAAGVTTNATDGHVTISGLGFTPNSCVAIYETSNNSAHACHVANKGAGQFDVFVFDTNTGSKLLNTVVTFSWMAWG